MEGIRGRRAESIIWDESVNFSDMTRYLRRFSGALCQGTIHMTSNQMRDHNIQFFKKIWEYSEFDDGSIIPLENF